MNDVAITKEGGASDAGEYIKTWLPQYFLPKNDTPSSATRSGCRTWSSGSLPSTTSLAQCQLMKTKQSQPNTIICCLQWTMAIQRIFHVEMPKEWKEWTTTIQMVADELKQQGEEMMDFQSGCPSQVSAPRMPRRSCSTISSPASCGRMCTRRSSAHLLSLRSHLRQTLGTLTRSSQPR
uniref:Uncharacterized protein n=1 Tax=Sus scrofa TaxID=9823 RepID=A0A8D0I0Y6_PIG